MRSLHEAGIEATPEMPQEPGRIPALIRDGAAGCDMIVLGGGDGTLSHALDAILATGPPLGILPMGNANDLARTLGIPDRPAPRLPGDRRGQAAADRCRSHEGTGIAGRISSTSPAWASACASPAA